MYKQGNSNFWEGLPALDKPRSASIPKYEYEPALAEVEAQAILQRARSESAELLADAKATANALRLSVNEECESLKSAAIEAGTPEGYELAKLEIRQELDAAFQQRVEELNSDLQLLIDSIATQRKELWEKTELDVVAFVMEMAKRVVKVEVQQNPKVVGEMIRHALRRVADKENIRIRVCPDELEGVRADRKDLLLVLDGARNLEIVDDRRIGRGGCVVETNAGTIDARIDTQFEQIADKIGLTDSSREASE